MKDQELVQMALDAREHAYAPYSHFQVGAALLCEDGSVFTGCNVENAAYSCGICAERTAGVKALSEGHRNFVTIAVAGSSEELCTPCGLCRQFLFEFAPQMRVLCANQKGEYEVHTLNDLLKAGFGGKTMGE